MRGPPGSRAILTAESISAARCHLRSDRRQIFVGQVPLAQRQQRILLAGQVRFVASAYFVHERRRKIRALAACNAREQRPQRSPDALEASMLLLEPHDEIASGKRAREQSG